MRALEFVSIYYLGHWNLFRQGCGVSLKIIEYWCLLKLYDIVFNQQWSISSIASMLLHLLAWPKLIEYISYHQ